MWRSQTSGDAEGPQVNAIDPDLSGFEKRHGKLIEYHGWVDPGFTPEFNIEYYERVVARMRQTAAGKRGTLRRSKILEDFLPALRGARNGALYGGPGPNAFGGLAQPAAPIDPNMMLLTALEEWVEHGVAPAANHRYEIPERRSQARHCHATAGLSLSAGSGIQRTGRSRTSSQL